LLETKISSTAKEINTFCTKQ